MVHNKQVVNTVRPIKFTSKGAIQVLPVRVVGVIFPGKWMGWGGGCQVSRKK